MCGPVSGSLQFRAAARQGSPSFAYESGSEERTEVPERVRSGHDTGTNNRSQLCKSRCSCTMSWKKEEEEEEEGVGCRGWTSSFVLAAWCVAWKDNERGIGTVRERVETSKVGGSSVACLVSIIDSFTLPLCDSPGPMSIDSLEAALPHYQFPLKTLRVAEISRAHLPRPQTRPSLSRPLFCICI